MTNGGSNPTPADARSFRTTHWSVILAARGDESPGASEALEKLCRTYWFPLYAYIRREGHGVEDAQDLTQAFFERFLEKKSWAQARRDRGRFRSFLLVSLKHFLINEWKRANTLKRGSGIPLLSFDAWEAERAYNHGPAHDLTPDKLYERSWALALLEDARSRLQEEFASAGKADRFEVLEEFLPGAASELTYAQAAHQLGVPEGTVKSEVHRLKQRYRELLRTQIANTVANRADIADELRHLMDALS